MKGIILAGGNGSRLSPVTKGVSKQLLPVYDKPMIYYPLSVLMLAGIRDILIITRPEDTESFTGVLGHGERFGLNITYATQEEPKGLVQAFTIGKEFVGKDQVSLILGDNVFYGTGFSAKLQEAANRKQGASIFGYQVRDPERFGVVSFDKQGKAVSLLEKPKNPQSNYAVTGLYFYDNDVLGLAEEVRPSARGELEITDLNRMYLEQQSLHVEVLGRGFAWLDTGTHDSLLEASHFVKTIENQQGFKIACLEEIAFNQGWITLDDLYQAGETQKLLDYGQYLINLANEA